VPVAAGCAVDARVYLMQELARKIKAVQGIKRRMVS
jgi:hypothetical protein